MHKNMNVELENKLWAACDELRGNQSSEEYMHIIIGIMFLKHMSDKFNIALKKIEIDFPDNFQELIKDKDFLITKHNVSFIIPEKANWTYIEQYASQPTIGEVIDNALLEIENINPSLKGLFNKNYNRPELDQIKLGKVVSIFSNVDLNEFGEDIIGRTYEYFLGHFFKKQGQKGGEFYTPKSVVELMVNILNPTQGTLYDPCCGTGGMFVQARKKLEKDNKDVDGLVIFGQESQTKTWQLAKINLLIHGFNELEINLGHKSADTFSDDLFKNKSATFDYVLANPPFNIKKWNQENLLDDKRWQWGIPPKGNANYAWLSHIMEKLNKTGKAAVILANGSLSSSQKNEIEIRKNFLKDNLIEGIIALPDKLFYTTGISACIWILNKNKKNNNVLMINCESLGVMVNKTLRELSEDDIAKVTKIYNDNQIGDVNIPGIAKTISWKEIEDNDYSLVPGRYIEIVEEKIDIKQTKEEIKELFTELTSLLKEFDELKLELPNAIEKALNFEKEE
ncbi:class I SAM-dependent DNA methyltransferase [Spiroplasma sp. SV19]|uniref:type I restriction-modification system subunit M n=1 Tax=Spiroplasma sp. SV19 TaxID=2570468 RepID=UPI0024B79AB9|nr:class I SAM-dependent DNA methyltransferase [Spiroplasma sp. SV19]WHQ37494.1 N-6 DNA methylase [Spiroplasma sp. SV19]